MIINDLGRLYSVDKLAELLNVEKETIYKWIREGKLKALKLAGTTFRVPENELEKFLLQALYCSTKVGR